MDTAERLSDFIRPIEEFEPADREAQKQIAAAATDPRERKPKDLVNAFIALGEAFARRDEARSTVGEALAQVLARQVEVVHSTQQAIEAAITEPSRAWLQSCWEGAVKRLASNLSVAASLSPDIATFTKGIFLHPEVAEALRRVQVPTATYIGFTESMGRRVQGLTGVPSISDALANLAAAGFPDAGAWTMRTFRQLVDAGVFDGNPDTAELGQRIRKIQEANAMDTTLDVKEAARELGISVSAFHNHIQRKRETPEAVPVLYISGKAQGKGRGRFILHREAFDAWRREHYHPQFRPFKN